MSRDIQFKAWSLDENKMYYPAFPTWNGGIEVWRDNKAQSETTFFSMHGEVDEAVLLEYTGKRDKNDALMFDGDIVEFQFVAKTYTARFKGKIFYEDFMWCVETDEGEIFSINRITDVEVIGNIYENPELLTP